MRWLTAALALDLLSEPEPLPAPVNSDAAEWFPRPAVDGWLYFGSRRPAGHGKDDIWRARERRRDRLYPNQNGTEIGPLIAPDSSSFMFSRDAGDGASGELFIARVSSGVGWVPKCPRAPSGR